ncbi:MAG: hypothetical protein WBR26_07285 [Candidatus Acidiferrum sp.]
MKAHLFTAILLVGILTGCQTRKMTIFLDQSWNRENVKNACEVYTRTSNNACVRIPRQMADDLRGKFASAFLQSRACKGINISYDPVGDEAMKDYLSGWSLTFDIGIDSRDIDYTHSVWQMLDNKTKRRFEGPLRDVDEAAMQICRLANGQHELALH